jgi:hypothetical protein
MQELKHHSDSFSSPLAWLAFQSTAAARMAADAVSSNHEMQFPSSCLMDKKNNTSSGVFP